MSGHLRCRMVLAAGLLAAWSSFVLAGEEPPRERLPGTAWTSGDAALEIGETGETSVVPWYVGVDGGYAFGLNDTPNVEHAGVGHDITALGTHLQDAGLVNVRLGRRLSPCWRVDVSYTWMEGNYDWQWFRESTPGTLGGTFFDSSAACHLLLVNGYRHLFPLAERCGKLQFDPYVGAGIGVAFNRMSDADQTVITTGDVVTTIFPDTTANFAARFALGSQFWLTSTLALDLSFTTTYVGNIQTDAFTVIQSTGEVRPLGRYDFHDNWIGAAQVGLIWYPRPGFLRR
jgi:hypothetical protein